MGNNAAWRNEQTLKMTFTEGLRRSFTVLSAMYDLAISSLATW